MVKQGDIMMNPIRLLIQGDHKIKVKVRKKIRAFILKKKKKLKMISVGQIMLTEHEQFLK